MALKVVLILLLGVLPWVVSGCDRSSEDGDGSLSAALHGGGHEGGGCDHQCGNEQPRPPHKVLLCHKGDWVHRCPFIIEVDWHAAKHHILHHGDWIVTEEVCNGRDDDCDCLTDEDGVCPPDEDVINGDGGLVPGDVVLEIEEVVTPEDVPPVPDPGPPGDGGFLDDFGNVTPWP